MAIIPGVNSKDIDPDLAKSIGQFVQYQKEMSENAKHSYETFSKTNAATLAYLNLSDKQRKEDYKLFTKEYSERLRKEDDRTVHLLSILGQTHRLMNDIRSDSKAMRDYIMSERVNRYIMDRGKELSKQFGIDRRRLADRNLGASFAEHFLKKLPLAQMLSGHYVGTPGSSGEILKEKNRGLLGAAESDYGDIQGASLLEHALGGGTGDPYIGLMQGAREKQGLRSALIANAAITGLGKKEGRDARGRFTRGNVPWNKGSEELKDALTKKSPIKPTKAFVANLPAAYGAGSLLIADMLEEGLDIADKSKAKNKGGGGSSILGGVGGGLIGGLLSLLSNPVTWAAAGTALAAAVVGAIGVAVALKLEEKKKEANMTSFELNQIGKLGPKVQEALGINYADLTSTIPHIGTGLLDQSKSASVDDAMAVVNAWKALTPAERVSVLSKGNIPSPKNSMDFSRFSTAGASTTPSSSTAKLEELIAKLHEDMVAEMKKNNDLTKQGNDLASKESPKPIDNPTGANVPIQ